MATQKKIDIVQNLTDKLGKAKSVVFADYTGLKHKQLETVRKALKKTGAQFVVAKNTLLLRSMGDKADSLKDMLKKNTGVLFNFDDEVAGLKELVKFFKLAGTGSFKAGILGNQILTSRDINTLAELPGKQELIAQLARQLNAPISGLHYALSWNMNKLVWGLNNIKNKKS